MTIDELLLGSAVLMAVTAAAIGLAKRLNLGSIAALLGVGILLGPHSPAPLQHVHVGDLQAVGEIGVMLLLFLVGLDTQPGRLWSLRRLVLGFGSLEYLATAVMIGLFLLLVSRINWQSAVIVGLGLAMSSSAVPLPILEAREESASEHGRATIAADIFQGLMVIPVLALIPLLGSSSATIDQPAAGVRLLGVLAALASVFVLGQVLLPYSLRIMARNVGSGAFALIVLAGVCAAAWIMDKVGISMALGAFLTGVLLSTSVYAAQVKAAVTPARHVLLGVFFVAVGMAIDLQQVAAFRGELPFYVATVLFIKLFVVYWVARALQFDRRAAVLTGLLLMPLDEIGYIVFASAHAHGLLSERAYALALLSISASFLVSPIAINLGLRWQPGAPRPTRRAAELQIDDEIARDRVVVVGYGHIGRAICTLLEWAGAGYVCLDTDPDRIAAGISRGHVVNYGDAANRQLIEAAAIPRARLVVIALERFSESKQVFANVHEGAPHVAVLAAVQYLAQRDELRRLGATRVIALAPESVIAVGRAVLDSIAVDPVRADALVNTARAADYAALREPPRA